jgi:D-3-phosphoglycerate dehydrogenase
MAFGMKVYAYDPYRENSDFEGIYRVGYTELLRMCNIVSYHVPYTKETHRMLNRNLFEDMLDGMIVINACRGEVMNEQDLLYGLEIGKISRIGLDVFSKEPLDPKSPLFRHPQVICTPHIGATTEKAFESSSLEATQKCMDYFKGQKLADILPYDKPWWNYTFRRS